MRNALTPMNSGQPYSAAASAIDAVTTTSTKYMAVATIPISAPCRNRARGSLRVASQATTKGTTTVTYTRDATDRITQRVSSTLGLPVSTQRYGFSGSGDSSDFTMAAVGSTVIERTIALPGGVILTKRTLGDVWSYPNVHGDVVTTASFITVVSTPALFPSPTPE